jgi:hypothetical protein
MKHPTTTALDSLSALAGRGRLLMGMLGLAVIALAVGIVYLERVRVIEEETTRA